MACTFKFMITYSQYKRLAVLALFIFLAYISLQETKGQAICIDRGDKVPVNGKIIYICEGKSLSLSARLCTVPTVTVSYLWTYLNDTYIYTKNPKFTVPDTGAYEIVITVKSGPVYKDTIHVKYLATPFFQINENPIPLKCEGVPLTIKATRSSLFSNYKWYTPDDTTALSRTDTLYDVKKGTAYIVEALDNNKCLVGDTIEIVQSPFVPKVDLGPKSKTVCDNEIVVLENLLTDNYDHFWNTGDQSSSIVVTTSGKYWLKVRNSYRCTATDTINIFIVPSPKITVAQDFYSCYGSGVQLQVGLNGNPDAYSYEWTPKVNISNDTIKNPLVSPTASAVYKVRVFTKEVSTCSDTASVKVLINPKINTTVTPDVVNLCNGKSQSIKALATGGTPNLTALYPYSYTWSPSVGLDNANTNEVVAKPSASTTYKVSVKDAKGCLDSTTVSVNISGITLAIDAQNVNSVCLGDSLRLKAVVTPKGSAYTYHWVNNYAVISDTASSDTWFIPKSAGAAQLYVSAADAGGCNASATISLQVVDKPKLSLSYHSKKMCVGDTVPLDLHPSGGSGQSYTFTWLPDHDNIVNANTSAPSIAGIEKNTGVKKFNVFVTDSKSCKSAMDTLTLETVPNFQVYLGSTDTSACLGTDIILSPAKIFNKGLKFSWTNNSTGNIISTDSILTVNTSGTYKLSIKNPGTGCAAAGYKKVSFNTPASSPAIAADSLACSNSLVLLAGKASGGDIVYSWTSNGAGTILGANKDTAYYKPAIGEEGIKNISLLVRNNCGAPLDTTMSLRITPAPVLSASYAPVEALTDSLIVFTATYSHADSIFWNYGDGSPQAGGQLSSHVFTQEKEYAVVVTATNVQGCKTQDTVKVMVGIGQKIKELYIPTVFSPLSSDKDNNAFKVFGKNISSDNFILRVYNKWGEVIYHTDNFQKAKEEGWNGSLVNADQLASVGVYTYTVKGSFSDGTPFEQAGTVTLLR